MSEWVRAAKKNSTKIVSFFCAQIVFQLFKARPRVITLRCYGSKLKCNCFNSKLKLHSISRINSFRMRFYSASDEKISKIFGCIKQKSASSRMERIINEISIADWGLSWTFHFAFDVVTQCCWPSDTVDIEWNVDKFYEKSTSSGCWLTLTSYLDRPRNRSINYQRILFDFNIFFHFSVVL